MRSEWWKGRMNSAMAKKQAERTTLPDGLRQAVTNSGKTSYQLMAETGVNHGVILRFMKGERDIRLETADKLAAAVGLIVQVPTRKKSTGPSEGSGD